MPRRRWLQFSIRTLLVVTTLVGIGLAIGNGHAARQKDAVEAILAHGGRVTYDWQVDTGWDANLHAQTVFVWARRVDPLLTRQPQGFRNFRTIRPPPTEAEFPSAADLGVPRWLRKWLGPHYFHDVVAVDLFAAENAADALPWLDDLAGLRELDLGGSGLEEGDIATLPRLPRLERLKGVDFTDASLVCLANFPALRELDLRGQTITDAGMPHLVGLKHLEILLLDDVPVTDAGLAHLAGLATLRELSLRNTRITDRSLEIVGRFGGLRRLDLGETLIQGEQLQPLASLMLEELSLDRSATSDGALRHLAGMTSLKRLILGHTAVTDAGLVHLRGLKNLTWLQLHGTQVTRDGAGELDEALPGNPIVR